MTDFLPHTNLTLEQLPGHFHMNTDTVLLGQFLCVHSGDVLLDIGTSTGALLLYAGLQKPRKMLGVDLHAELLACARRNLARNHMEAELFCMPVQRLVIDPVDVIVCNPPYFSTAMKKENTKLATARHADTLSLTQLFDTVKRLLKDNGHFFMIHRPACLSALLRQADGAKLKLIRLCPVYETKDTAAKAILLEFQKGRGKETEIPAPRFLNP
mgnify:CR=1 FL=1